MAQDAGQLSQTESQTPPDAVTSEEEAVGHDSAEGRAHAVSARKPGPVRRLLHGSQGLVQAVAPPRWDFRTAFYVLIALIVILWLWRNWAPWRVDFFVWELDLPMPIWFVLNLAFGALIYWAWHKHCAPRAGQSEGEQATPEPSPPGPD